MKKIAIFASGSGSNAENIIIASVNCSYMTVDSVFCNVPDAFVLERAKKYHIPTFVFTRNELNDPGKILRQLRERKIDFIVLAGFLWLIPSHIIAAYPARIINIHPALLPLYGGKGMYGMRVHEAVIAAREKKSGITIHYVNEHYDKGNVIFQAYCDIMPSDTPDTLAQKVHALEYEYFPAVIMKTLSNLKV